MTNADSQEKEPLEIATIETQIDKYCLTNNDHWRDTRCHEIIRSIETAPDARYQSKVIRLQLARAYGHLGKFEDTAAERATAKEREQKVYEELLDQDPNDVQILYRYALSLPTERSIAVFRKLLQLEPEHINGHAILAARLQRLGGRDNLTEAAEHRLFVYRNEAPNMKLYAAMKAYEAYVLANLPAAAEEFRNLVKVDVGAEEAVSMLDSLTRADVELEQEVAKIGGIIDHFCVPPYFVLEISEPCIQATSLAEELSHEHVNSPALLHLAVRGLRQAANYFPGYRAALQNAYARLLKLEPESIEALYGYAQLLTGSDRFEVLKRIVQLNPKAPGDMHYSLAQEYMQRGQSEKAIVEFRRAFELAEPRFKRSFGEDLVRILRNEGLDEEALGVERELQRIG